MSERLRFPLAEGPQLRAELRRHLAGRWGRLALAMLTLVVGAAVSFLGPWATGSLVDVVSGASPRSSLTPLVVTVLVAPLVGLVLTRYGGYQAAVVIEGVVSDIRTRVVDRLLRLPLEVVRRRGAGDAVSRASDDVSTLATGVREIVPAIGGVFVTIGITLVGLFAVQWQLGLALLLIVPVELWAIRAFLRDAPPVYLAERAATGERGEAVLSSLQGLPSVRAFRMERQRHELIAEHSWTVARLSVKQRIVNNVLWGRMNLAELVGMSALLVAGFFLVRAETTTVGSVTVALLAFHRLFGPIGQLLNLVDTWQSASASLRRVVGILGLDAERHGPGLASRRGGARLRVEHVHCSYDDAPPAVDDVTLEVPVGQTLAVVGASGAGKTTLARVVAGTIAPDSGRVLLDGIDADDLPATERSRAMMLVAQDLHVFDGSVRDQLTLADAEADDDDLWDALRRTGAHEWVERLPDGIDEVVGSLGRALTSQQVQHLALARVLLMDPPVVLLDEATAEAGSQGAASLDRASEAVVAGRTAIVIAHRLDQAQQADRVAVMERGAVVEEGTHTELVARGGVYARLWEAWSSAPVA